MSVRSLRFVVLFTATLAVAIAGLARADHALPGQDTERLAAAKSLLEAIGAAKQFDAVMPLMMAQMQDSFMQMSPEHGQEIREVMTQLADRFSKRKSELFDQIAPLYSERFTAVEMGELTKLFGSGIGAKFIQLQPEMVQQSMLIGQRWGEKIGQEIDREMRDELAKRGIKI